MRRLTAGIILCLAAALAINLESCCCAKLWTAQKSRKMLRICLIFNFIFTYFYYTFAEYGTLVNVKTFLSAH